MFSALIAIHASRGVNFGQQELCCAIEVQFGVYGSWRHNVHFIVKNVCITSLVLSVHPKIGLARVQLSHHSMYFIDHLEWCLYYVQSMHACCAIILHLHKSIAHSKLIALKYGIPMAAHTKWIQYIPRNMHTVLLCFALLWLCNRS